MQCLKQACSTIRDRKWEYRGDLIWTYANEMQNRCFLLLSLAAAWFPYAAKKSRNHWLFTFCLSISHFAVLSPNIGCLVDRDTSTQTHRESVSMWGIVSSPLRANTFSVMLKAGSVTVRISHARLLWVKSFSH